jgi:protein-S-isoprenylcysteine O-methyltransferase Ste14
MLLLHFALPGAYWNVGPARWAGLPFALLGTLLVLLSVRRFGALGTTLRPFEEPSLLVTQGGFRFSRNPMYAGMGLALVGAAIMLGSATPLLVIPLYVAIVQVRFIAHEERVLERRFGAAYRDYRRRVRRWF